MAKDDKTLKDVAQDNLKSSENTSQLGDPVSLKAETSDTQPTKNDKPVDDKTEKEKKSLKELAKENPTMLGDPVSLKAEKSDSEPTDQDRGASLTKRERDSKL